MTSIIVNNCKGKEHNNAYVPKKGDIVCFHNSNEGISDLNEIIDESVIEIGIYPNLSSYKISSMWLVGISLERINELKLRCIALAVEREDTKLIQEIERVFAEVGK